MTGTTSLDDPAAWADLLTALSAGLRHPDDVLVAAVKHGEFRDALADSAGRLGLQPTPGIEPPVEPSVGELTEAYVGLFEALETPYAPNAESPYKAWYGGRSGLMEGPPAEAMSRRYAAVDVEFPDGYPSDHVALLLEYGSLLLDAGAEDVFVAFVDDHLDWIPALRLATEGAAADAPFHRWVVRLLDDVTATLRSRLALEPVGGDAARRMVDRVDDATAPAPTP